MSYFIGIDVAKATLQIYIPQGEIDLEFANTKSGLKKLYKTLKASYKELLQDLVFVYESTGCYSRPLEMFCQEMKINCFKVGAYQSASFSKTIKNRNKTDKVDARMLSAMQILVCEGDIKVPYRDENAHQLRSYIKHYQSLNKEKTRQKITLKLLKLTKKMTIFLSKLKKESNKLIKSKIT
ncbi:MAG: transposase [Methyloprofundus sp.]|nr:transposase [Methyloprofundus sp.]